MSPEIQKILIALEPAAHRVWISKATDELLDEYVSNISENEHYHRMALAERERRHFNHLSRPHWSVTPNFWFSFTACLAAIAAAVFAYRADLGEQRRDHTGAASGSPASQATSAIPSPLSNSPSMKP